MLSLLGHDIPLGRTTHDKAARQQFFDIIAHYFLSAEAIRTVGEAEQEEMTLWLETITATQKGLLYTSLNIFCEGAWHCKTFPAEWCDSAA
jgi:hypothetical protein